MTRILVTHFKFCVEDWAEQVDSVMPENNKNMLSKFTRLADISQSDFPVIIVIVLIPKGKHHSQKKSIERCIEYVKDRFATKIVHVITTNGIEDIDPIVHDTKIKITDIVIKYPTDTQLSYLYPVTSSNRRDAATAVRGIFTSLSGNISNNFTRGDIIAYGKKSSDKTSKNLLATENLPVSQEKREEARQKIITNDPTMTAIIDRCVETAGLNDLSNVLLIGETGTGKELLADILRGDRKMRTVNMVGLTETILESQLFGHVEGAFTGATKTTRGLFRTPDTDILFLDEIGYLPPYLQVKLLRAIENKKVTPVGSDNDEEDVTVSRFIFATSKPDNLIEDLYYRISTSEIEIPPLRDRQGDIGLITKQRLQNIPIEKAALNYLDSLPWEGNVRELLGTIDRIVNTGTKNVTEAIVRSSLCYRTKRSIDKKESLTLQDSVLPYPLPESFEVQIVEGSDNQNLSEDLNTIKYKIIQAAYKKFGAQKKAANFLRQKDSSISRFIADYTNKKKIG